MYFTTNLSLKKITDEQWQPYYELFLMTCRGFESTASLAVYQIKLCKTFDRTIAPVVLETTEGLPTIPCLRK
jgi:hypothetical protein